MKFYLIAFSALVAFGLAEASDAHWSYPDLDEGESFPDWGGICDTGKAQSPINLSLNGALKGEFDKFNLKNYDQQQPGVSMVNNGHSIQLSGFPYEMTLSGGPLLAKYVVEQVHFHWWSEHTIDNVRYPLEVHIVHRNTGYKDMDEATQHKDGITVLGVLYHVSNQPNDAIEEVLNHIDDVKSYKNISKPITMKEGFVMDDLVPLLDNYFTYAGSLTTPSCAEAVTWIVFQDTFPVTLDQVDKFKEIQYDEGKELKNNYRFIQNTNNRAVVAAFNDATPCTGGSGILHASSLLSVLLMAAIAKFLGKTD